MNMIKEGDVKDDMDLDEQMIGGVKWGTESFIKIIAYRVCDWRIWSKVWMGLSDVNGTREEYAAVKPP